eukprot:494757-Rhodomonas_salina.1
MLEDPSASMEMYGDGCGRAGFVRSKLKTISVSTLTFCRRNIRSRRSEALNVALPAVYDSVMLTVEAAK